MPLKWPERQAAVRALKLHWQSHQRLHRIAREQDLLRRGKPIAKLKKLNPVKNLIVTDTATNEQYVTADREVHSSSLAIAFFEVAMPFSCSLGQYFGTH